MERIYYLLIILLIFLRLLMEYSSFLDEETQIKIPIILNNKCASATCNASAGFETATLAARRPSYSCTQYLLLMLEGTFVLK